MTVPYRSGQYGVRFAQTTADLAACQALRHRCFLGTDGCDADRFDAHCQHLMIANDAGLVCTARLFLITDAGQVADSYTAQSYDIEPFLCGGGAALELGRFCIAQEVQDTDILRLAWGALAEYVDAQGVAMIFGCTSFAGTDPHVYKRGFSLLAARYRGAGLLPARRADDVIALVDHGLRGGAAELPALLRSYLAMGGWVGDHAVIDRALGTIHVFTALEIAKIPPARAKALRAMIA